MKICACCGIPNEEALESCKRCGTELPFLNSGTPPIIFSNQPVLNGGRVTIILLVWLGVQITASIPAVFFVSQTGRLTNLGSFGAIVILSFLASGLVLLLLPLTIPVPYLRDVSPTGAAWVRGPIKGITQGFVLGVLFAACYVVIAIIFAPADPDRTMGPLATMASTPGLPQIEWLIGALLLAPPIEELLFRGVLFAGYNQSFGKIRATILTTVIFCLLHINEAIHFLPSFIGIATLSLAAIHLRLRFSAIGPAIALHFGYNATIGVTAICFA